MIKRISTLPRLRGLLFGLPFALLFAILFTLMLLATSCGNNPPEPPRDVSEQAAEQQLPVKDGEQQLPDGGGDNPPGLLPNAPENNGGQHLSAEDIEQRQPLEGGERIRLTFSYVMVIPSIKAAIERFEALHPEVDVVLHEYDMDKYREQLTVQLLAGDADDMFLAGYLTDNKIVESGYLADLYPLMRNDPTFNEDDYYMNAIHSLSHNGKLLFFTPTFYYDMYGVNNRFTTDLVTRFQQYETVTHRQIFELYQKFAAESGLYAYQELDVLNFLARNILEYVDFEKKTCDFMNEAFIQLLRDLKTATNPQQITYGMVGTNGDSGYIFTTPMFEEAAQKYMFKFAITEYLYYPAFFPFVEPQAFVDFKPVVNEAGSLLINTYPYSISEASQNKELAWEFLKFLASPEANEDFHIYGFPVHRGLFQSYMMKDVADNVEYWRAQKPIEGDNEAVAARQLAIYERYLDMPMEESSGLYMGIYKFLQESVSAYYQDVLTAEQVASELQNKISLYLIE